MKDELLQIHLSSLSNTLISMRMKIVSRLASDVPSEANTARAAVLIPEFRHQKSPPAQRKIALPTMDGICFEKIQDIICLRAEGNYTTLFFKNGHQIMVCKTLREMEKSIGDQHQFVRVHRSHTINLNYLKKYVRGKGGHCILENDINITVSMGKKSDFLNALERYF